MDFEQAKPLIKQHALKSDDNLRIAYWTYCTWYELYVDICRAFYNDIEKELASRLNSEWKITNEIEVFANEGERGVLIEKITWGGAIRVGMYRHRTTFVDNFYGVCVVDAEKTLLSKAVLDNITNAVNDRYGRGKVNLPWWAWWAHLGDGFRTFKDNIEVLSVISGVKPDARSKKLNECASDICKIADIVSSQVDDFLMNKSATA